MRLKTVKDVEKALSGGEPVWLDGEGVSISQALNWYNYHSDTKESKKYVLQYLKSIKSSKSDIELFSKISDSNFSNLGFVCRIKMNGAPLTEKNEQWIKDSLNKLKNGYKPVVAEKTTTEKKVVSIQDRVADKAREYIAELEGKIDECIASKDFTSISAYNMMQSLGVKGAHTKFIVAHFTKLNEELKLALLGKDKQLIEGYSNFNKTQLKAFQKLIDSIITDAQKLNDNAKITRTPRKKKAKPVEKVISKLNYKKQDNEYKLASVNPADIIGASQLWVFNTKTRKLGCYVAMDSDGLNVKGSSVINFNETLSVHKTVRKPDVVLPQLLKAGKVSLRKVLPGINAVEQNLTGRINGDTILLRIIK